MQAQLRWTGHVHVVRMPDHLPPNELLLVELQHGIRSLQRPEAFVQEHFQRFTQNLHCQPHLLGASS